MRKLRKYENKLDNKYSPNKLKRIKRQEQRWTWWDRENEPTMKFFDCAFEFCGAASQKNKSERKFEDIPDFFWSRTCTEAYFEMLGKCAAINVEAAVRLHYVATLAVQYLNETAYCAPHNLQPIAKTQITWPGYLSDHPDAENTQKKFLFPLLKLGENSGIRLKGKKFSLETVETRIALELWGKMEYARNDKKSGPPFDETPLGKIGADTKKLPTLTRENYRLWWKVGEKLFLLKFGDKFESNPIFSNYWKKNHPVYKGEPNARALIRRDIKKKIQQGFRSIAAKSSVV